MPETMFRLEQEVRKEIRDNATELLREVYPEDTITEYVDSSVPVYNSTLLELAASNNSLALDEPEILAFDGTATPINAIAGNIYERLSEVANEEWESIKDEAEGCAECGAPTLVDDGKWVNGEDASYSMSDPHPGSDGDFTCNVCLGVDE